MRAAGDVCFTRWRKLNATKMKNFCSRSMVTIISQDPFIFAGSIRENVDPLNEHSDFDIWEALNRCKLVPLVIRLGGMSTLLKSGGVNISAGERQMLCLVRAALRNNKVNLGAFSSPPPTVSVSVGFGVESLYSRYFIPIIDCLYRRGYR